MRMTADLYNDSGRGGTLQCVQQLLPQRRMLFQTLTIKVRRRQYFYLTSSICPQLVLMTTCNDLHFIRNSDFVWVCSFGIEYIH